MAEFNIRLFAFRRMTRDKEMLFREVAWASVKAPHMSYKDVPKSKQQYWQIEHEKKIDIDERKALAEMMRTKIKQYKQSKNV